MRRIKSVSSAVHKGEELHVATIVLLGKLIASCKSQGEEASALRLQYFWESIQGETYKVAH